MAAAAMTFQGIIDELLHATGASRTTLRLEEPGGDFPVVAEALAPGIRSIKGSSRISVRNSATFAFFERERRILVVNDCRTSDPPTPQELMDFYGVRAEILAPLLDGERIIGIVSVHHAPGPREWTEVEIDALTRASARILGELKGTAGR